MDLIYCMESVQGLGSQLLKTCTIIVYMHLFDNCVKVLAQMLLCMMIIMWYSN